MNEEWLSAKEIADLMHVGTRTVHRWLSENRMHGINVGGKVGWRIRRSEFERFVRETEERSKKAAA
jgi:excisionase family DNA binding protein